jgi:hypothetical protein
MLHPRSSTQEENCSRSSLTRTLAVQTTTASIALCVESSSAILLALAPELIPVSPDAYQLFYGNVLILCCAALSYLQLQGGIARTSGHTQIMRVAAMRTLIAAPPAFLAASVGPADSTQMTPGHRASVVIPSSDICSSAYASLLNVNEALRCVTVSSPLPGEFLLSCYLHEESCCRGVQTAKCQPRME